MLEMLECCPIPQFALGPDHKVTFWNRACEQLTGFAAAEMVGTSDHWKPFYKEQRPTLADLLLQDDFDSFLFLYRDSSPGRSDLVPFAWEATSFFKNIGGESRFLYFLAAPVFDGRGEKIGVVETLQDISRQKQYELEMEDRSAELELENRKLRSSLGNQFKLAGIIGKSRAMQEVQRLTLRAAESDDNAIIYGESGTGKELVARAIHDNSRRHDKEFVIVNCGAIPETLAESEFFGHKKGAFTGAFHEQKGYLSAADGGTLFLDEVAELSPGVQVKLLRALENREFTPLGANRPRKTDVRIVAATNKNLPDLVRTGRIREDFFYRIHVIPITLPPLRERREDLPLLVDYFLCQYAPDISPTGISREMMARLREYRWPGNIRELQNVLKRYAALGELNFAGKTAPDEPAPAPDLQTALKNCEKELIIQTLQKKNWHRQQAADALNISRKTLFRKMTYHNIL